MRNINYRGYICLAAAIILYAMLIFLLPRQKKQPTKTQNLELTPAAKESDPCTDPYYTVEIDGVTWSGSTKTADEIYRYDAAQLTKIFTSDLPESEKLKKMKFIMDQMKDRNKFRCKCPKYCESFSIVE